MLVRAANPLQYASGYALDLYCDHFDVPNLPTGNSSDEQHQWNEFPHSFTAETFTQCVAQAKSVGWKIHRATRTATCPKCARVNITHQAPEGK